MSLKPNNEKGNILLIIIMIVIFFILVVFIISSVKTIASLMGRGEDIDSMMDISNEEF